MKRNAAALPAYFLSHVSCAGAAALSFVLIATLTAGLLDRQTSAVAAQPRPDPSVSRHCNAGNVEASPNLKRLLHSIRGPRGVRDRLEKVKYNGRRRGREENRPLDTPTVHDTIASAVATVVEACNRAGVTYMVTGGLAAKMYGVNRTLYDIDLIVAEGDLERCADIFAPFGASQPIAFANSYWRFNQVSFALNGWNVDLSGNRATVFSCKERAWVPWTSTFDNVTVMQLGSVSFNVEALYQLLIWKSLLRRPADIEDIRQLSKLSVVSERYT